MLIIGNNGTNTIKVNPESILNFSNYTGTISLFIYEKGIPVIKIEPIANYPSERAEEINKWLKEKLNNNEQIIEFPK